MLHRTAARVAGATLTTAALVLALAGPAAAAGTDASVTPNDDGSVTVTLDAETVAQLCEVRLPRALDRSHAALDRIQAGPDVKGSAAWVRDRAEKAAAGGHDDLARRLEFRADQRLGHVDELTALLDRLEQVEAVCSQVTP